MTARVPGAQRRGSRGSATIEMVALVPMVLLIMLLAFEVVAASYTTHAASQAARDAARAYSLDESPEAAAQASLPGGTRLVSLDRVGPHHGVVVVVAGPAVLPDKYRLIKRKVTMP